MRALAVMAPDLPLAGFTPGRMELLPTRLDALPPPNDVDFLLDDGRDDALLHLESQGYRDKTFLERLLRYHLWLVLRHPSRRVRTVALWLTPPPAEQRTGVIVHGDLALQVTTIVLATVWARDLLQDPRTACFAAGADGGVWSDRMLCLRVAKALKESNASWQQCHMAVVAAASRGRYKDMVDAMEQEQIEPVIIEDLVHIGEDIGYERGVKDGEDRGIIRGKREALVQLMSTRGLAVTEVHRQRIATCADTAQLERWFAAAVMAERADDVFVDAPNT